MRIYFTRKLIFLSGPILFSYVFICAVLLSCEGEIFYVCRCGGEEPAAAAAAAAVLPFGHAKPS